MTPPAQSRFVDTPMLVTGGASGIGRATLERATAEGAAVAILDKNGDAASALARALESAGHKAVAVVADVTDEGQVARAVGEATARLGAIRVLVNNAGGTKTETFEAADPASWRAELDLNLTSAWLVTRAILPSLLETGGAIVNVATVNALTAIAEPAYSAAKAGLLQLTNSLRPSTGRAAFEPMPSCRALSERPFGTIAYAIAPTCSIPCASGIRWGALACPKTWPQRSSSSPAPMPTSSMVRASSSTAD